MPNRIQEDIEKNKKKIKIITISLIFTAAVTVFNLVMFFVQ